MWAEGWVTYGSKILNNQYNIAMLNFILLLIFNVDKTKVLAVKRSKIDSAFGGMWAPPGGQIEKGESIEDAAKRELKEETGLDLKSISPTDFLNLTPTLKGTKINIVVRLASVTDGNSSTIDKEIEEIGWIPLTQLLESFQKFGLPQDAILAFISKLNA